MPPRSAWARGPGDHHARLPARDLVRGRLRLVSVHRPAPRPGTSRCPGTASCCSCPPFHSFAVVTAVQHLMGLAVGVMTTRCSGGTACPAGGPRWRRCRSCSTRTSSARARDPAERHVSASWSWWRSPSPCGGGGPPTVGDGRRGRAGRGGLPMAGRAAGTDRVPAVPGGAPGGLAGVRRGRGRGAVPLAGYVPWFDGDYGRDAFSNSDGIYLWSRTMTFANCAVIQPPRTSWPLCPRQPAQRPAASTFIWEKNSPLNSVRGPKFWPKERTGPALRAAGDRRPAGGLPRGRAARRFPQLLLEQPEAPERGDGPPVRVRLRDHALDLPRLPAGTRPHCRVRPARYGGATSTRAVEPFAGWMRGYQRFAYLPGALLGAAAGGPGRDRPELARGGSGGWTTGAGRALPLGCIGHAAGGAGDDRRLLERYALIAMPVTAWRPRSPSPRATGATPRQVAAPPPRGCPPRARPPPPPARSDGYGRRSRGHTPRSGSHPHRSRGPGGAATPRRAPRPAGLARAGPAARPGARRRPPPRPAAGRGRSGRRRAPAGHAPPASTTRSRRPRARTAPGSRPPHCSGSRPARFSTGAEGRDADHQRELVDRHDDAVASAASATGPASTRRSSGG